MHGFEHQRSSQTLAQGIAEYHRVHPNLVRGPQLSPDAQDFFRCHDVAHVVFGCGTSLPHEAVVKLSSIFGTTGSLSVLRGYRRHESVDIYRRLALSDIVVTVISSVVIVPRTIVRCLRQRKRWPWSGHSAHLHVALADLRSEYGIRVAGFHRERAGEAER